jgi:TPR repeat protein
MEERRVREAFGWFQKSARQGNSNAQFKLGQMYFGGKDVTFDKSQSYVWFFLAAEGGNKVAAKRKDEVFEGMNNFSRDQAKRYLSIERKNIKKNTSKSEDVPAPKNPGSK